MPEEAAITETSGQGELSTVLKNAAIPHEGGEAAAAGKAPAKRSGPFPLISHSTKKKTARKWKAEPARIKRWKSSWNVQSGERLGFFRR